MWRSMTVENFFKLREYIQWQDIMQELYKSVHGDNPLKMIKEDLVMINIQKVIETFR